MKIIFSGFHIFINMSSLYCFWNNFTFLVNVAVSERLYTLIPIIYIDPRGSWDVSLKCTNLWAFVRKNSLDLRVRGELRGQSRLGKERARQRRPEPSGPNWGGLPKTRSTGEVLLQPNARGLTRNKLNYKKEMGKEKCVILPGHWFPYSSSSDITVLIKCILFECFLLENVC